MIILYIFIGLFFINIGVFIFYKVNSSSLQKNVSHTRGFTSYKNNNCIVKYDRKVFLDKNVNYFRDIPCNGDIFRAFWIVYNYDFGKRDEDFLGSILLKWIRDGNIRLEDNDILFVSNPVNCNEMEEKLYRYMFQASIGNDKSGFLVDDRLSVNEFKEWCHNNYGKIVEWFSSCLDYEIDCLIKEGMIVPEKKKHNDGYGLKYHVSSSINKEALELAGLKKYFNDFTIIKDRDKMDVILFDNYLIYANLFGVCENVYEDLNDLYPELLKYMNIDKDMFFDDDDMNFASNWMIFKDN